MKDGIIYIGDKAYKKCKVVMLPTTKSSLFLHKGGDLCLNTVGDREVSTYTQPQHLYIISDEKIKEGDWYAFKGATVTYFIKQRTKQDIECNPKVLSHWKKIIATTDSSLKLRDTYWCVNCSNYASNCNCLSLPRPSDDFLKKYCEVNGKISDILVEYEEAGYWRNLHRKEINAPKPEFVYTHDELKIAKDNTISIKPVKDSWNREEHIADIKRLIELYTTTYKDGNINKWIDQNL